MIQKILIIVAACLLSPIIAGLLMGLEEYINGIIQRKKSVSILQPFYDVLKLFGKEKASVNGLQSVFILGAFVFAVSGIIILWLQENMLFIIFTILSIDIFILLGASTTNSIYSRMAAQRSSLRIFTYFPMLLLLAAGIYLVTGSLEISSFSELVSYPLIVKLPLLFISTVIAGLIKTNRWCFDFGTGERFCQEINAGIYTEFSGYQLALLQLVKWYEMIIWLGILTIFFTGFLWIGIVAAIIIHLVSVIFDHTFARFQWKVALRVSWLVGTGLAILNIVWLYLK